MKEQETPAISSGIPLYIDPPITEPMWLFAMSQPTALKRPKCVGKKRIKWRNVTYCEPQRDVWGSELCCSSGSDEGTHEIPYA